MLKKSFISLLISVASASAFAGPVINGVEWRQVTETEGLTWGQLDAIYDTTTGQLDTATTTLTNSLGQQVDFEGWTWAGVSDMNDLRVQLGVPNNAGTFAGFERGSEVDSTWAQDIINNPNLSRFDSLFNPTGLGANEAQLSGFLRELDPGNSSIALSAFVLDSVNPAVADQWSVSNVFSTSFSSLGVGAFLFRDAPAQPSSVPTPPALALLGLGLIGFSAMRCRAKAAA